MSWDWVVWFWKAHWVHVIDAIARLGTLGSAIAALFAVKLSRKVSSEQARRTERQLRASLFDRRFQLYEDFMVIMATLVIKFENWDRLNHTPFNDAETKAFNKIEAHIWSVEFLYGLEIKTYVSKAWEPIIFLAHVASSGDVTEEEVSKNVDVLKYLISERGRAVFDPYLQLRDVDDFASSVPAEHR